MRKKRLKGKDSWRGIKAQSVRKREKAMLLKDGGKDTNRSGDKENERRMGGD